MYTIIRLMRPKHYIKNFLIFVPVVFAKKLLEPWAFLQAAVGFVVFSLLASAIYIINDIRDVEEDRRHPVKCSRPIASGAVSTQMGSLLAGILIVVALGINLGVFGLNPKCLAAFTAYFLINLSYSMGLKNVPFLDIALLVSGFFLRVMYGAAIIGVEVSSWVSLTVITLAIYLGLGKRRNELKKCSGTGGGETRRVLKYYSTAFCNQFMNICMACTMVFYALWSTDKDTTERIGNNFLIWTVPLVFFILMKYCSDVEGDSYGDPVDVVLHDKALVFMCLVFGVVILGIVYFPGMW